MYFTQPIKMIYSKRLATLLARDGFKVLDMRKHPTIDKYLVWVFEDSFELRQAMEKHNKIGD